MMSNNIFLKTMLGVFVIVALAIVIYNFYLDKTIDYFVTIEPDAGYNSMSKDVDVIPKENIFKLSIEKINIEAPIILNIDYNNIDDYNYALTLGVAHMAGSPHPDEKGNVVILGHSSPYQEYVGDYGKIFANLGDLEAGDIIKIKGEKYGEIFQYKVREQKIVTPDEVSILGKTQNDQLTLITCWPIGSNAKRLIIIADKI